MKNIATDLANDLSLQERTIEAIREENFDCPTDLDMDDILDTVNTRIQEEVLSIDTHIVKTVLLGCGGPTRYYEITLDEEGNGIKGKYVNTAFDGYVETDDKRTEIYLSSNEIETIMARYMLGTYSQ